MDEITYKYFEPKTLDEQRQIYDIFRKVGKGKDDSGLVINRSGDTKFAGLYMAPIPNEIGQAVVAYSGETPVGVIACNRPKLKKLVSNTTHVVSKDFRGRRIGRGLESELMANIPLDFKITAYAGSSAAAFHIRDKSSWRVQFKFTKKGSLMMDVYHRNPNAQEHFSPDVENTLFGDEFQVFESKEVEDFVNACIANPDEKFNELREEVRIAKSFIGM